VGIARQRPEKMGIHSFSKTAASGQALAERWIANSGKKAQKTQKKQPRINAK
jgi:hypothetical protein